jgi:hypothetical protein
MATKLTQEQKERQALAKKVIALRAKGVKWDGDDGICKQLGIKSAMAGRALMREFGAAEQVKPLTGKRAVQQQEAQERRQKLLAERKAAREAKAKEDAKATPVAS